MRKKTPLLPALALFATLLLGACNGPKEALEDAPLAGAQIGGEFSLQDKAGKPVHWSDFRGKWRIVYFGYASCPDACPFDVSRMMQGFAAFEKAEPGLAKDVQPIFITVDPARDTPARVGEFAAAFSPRLLGLTGDPAEIAKAAKAFAVYYAKGKALPGGYIVDHSRVVFLFDREGRPIAMLPVEKGAEAVTAELKRWVR